MWQQWVNFILAAWLVLSGYMGLTSSAMATNVTITGIVIALLALWGALQHNSAQMHTREHRHAM